jgi:hypothetical protein
MNARSATAYGAVGIWRGDGLDKIQRQLTDEICPRGTKIASWQRDEPQCKLVRGQTFPGATAMRYLPATITLVTCALGAAVTAVQFAEAARAPNNDAALERLLTEPAGWVWAIAPYAALAAVAFAFRRRPAASILILCVTMPAILFALVDTFAYLRPLPPGTHEFARGLGYGTPLVPLFAAAMLAIAIKGYDGLRRLTNPSPCKS